VAWLHPEIIRIRFFSSYIRYGGASSTSYGAWSRVPRASSKIRLFFIFVDVVFKLVFFDLQLSLLMMVTALVR
jgi:hypothetical protein